MYKARKLKEIARLTFAALTLLTCSPVVVMAADTSKRGEAPVHIEAIVGSKLKSLKLSEKAAKRLDIQLAPILEQTGRKLSPYSAIVYDLNGVAWLYTSQEARTYVRHRVVVDSIAGDIAYLKDGPPAGTMVVTVGVSELYGAEKGVGH